MLLYWKDEDVHFQVLNDIPGVRLSDSIWNVDILRSEEWKNSDVMLIKVKQWRNNRRKLQCSSWAPSSHRFLSCPQQTHTLANRKRIINQQPCLCLSVLHLSVYRCLTTSCSFSVSQTNEFQKYLLKHLLSAAVSSSFSNGQIYISTRHPLLLSL